MATQLIESILNECEARKSYLTEFDVDFLNGIRSKLNAGEQIKTREYRQIGEYIEFIVTHAPDERAA